MEPDLLFQRVAEHEPRPLSLAYELLLRRLVVSAYAARMAGQDLSERTNQYDKSEVLLTWYSFAPFLGLNDSERSAVLLDLVRRGLQPCRRGGEAADQAILELEPTAPVTVQLETPVDPPQAYLTNQAINAVRSHPVRYIRHRGERHIAEGLRLEGHTRFDVWIEWPGQLAVGVEAKFTSDAKEGTDYNAIRNQIIRGIDAGYERVKGRGQFVYLLLVPRNLYSPRKRWFAYLLEEYARRPASVVEDLPHRHGVENVISGSLGCIFWDEMRAAVLERGVLDEEERRQLVRFYDERQIT
jgi:hypothetical protein